MATDKRIGRLRGDMNSSSLDPTALRRARERAGLTQHELARLVGAAGGERISRWELGLSEPRPGFIRRLSEVLGIETVGLVQYPGEGPDLRWLRLVAGLTAEEVAAALNASKETYARLESGRWARPPGEETLARLAEALDTSRGAVLVALERTRRI